MNFTEFSEKVKDRVETEMKEMNIRTSLEFFEKMNGQSYHSLAARMPSAKMAVSINLDDAYSAFRSGDDFDHIVSQIKQAIEIGMMNAPVVRTELFSDYELAKPHLTIALVSPERNRDMLEKVPYTMVKDLAEVYSIIVVREENSIQFVTITNDIAEILGVDAEQLHRDAPVTAQENEGISLAGITDEADPSVPVLAFASTETEIDGAKVLAYPEFFDKVLEFLMDKPFMSKTPEAIWIIPSSTKKIILMAGREKDVDMDFLMQGLECENSETPEEFFLSESLYRYDVSRGILETADEYRLHSCS